MAKKTIVADEERCAATVYKRDTYRVDRSAKGQRRGGFSMHYNRCQCSRRRVVGRFCAQHGKLLTDGRYISICEWARP